MLAGIQAPIIGNFIYDAPRIWNSDKIRVRSAPNMKTYIILIRNRNFDKPKLNYVTAVRLMKISPFHLLIYLFIYFAL